MDQHLKKNFKSYTYDMFIPNLSVEPDEITDFSDWISLLQENRIYAFEGIHLGMQTPNVEVVRPTGEHLKLLNFSSYNYLGMANHPLVIDAAIQALKTHGLGAASSPVLSGTMSIHQELERALLDHYDLPTHGVSLFSSGYGVNVGTIQAFAKKGCVIILDESAHMSMIEGARLSGAKVLTFKHNDMNDLESVLTVADPEFNRTLICVEGIYSADGDAAPLAEIVRLAKQYKAYTLVDEAHSAFIAGENGRGICESEGVLDQVDFYVLTFSKALGGVGGAVITQKAFARYINCFAACRMYSCAIDPAVTGGVAQSVRLASGPDGVARRIKIRDNVTYLRSLLDGKVDLGVSRSWITTIQFSNDAITADLCHYLQTQGLDTSILQFPAVPKNQGRIRLFVSSQHSREDLESAASIILDAAAHFGFLKV